MSMRSLFGALGFFLAFISVANALDEIPTSPKAGTSRALIIVGLAGDDEHAKLFRSTADRWREWLVDSLHFLPAEVRLLSGREAEVGFSDASATEESIGREVESLIKKAQPDERVWVFVLGHANLDEGHSFFHLPGPDLSDDRFAALFAGLAAHEQVFWITTAASGAFVKPLARAGRIVMAATERDGEANETEFPHALAEISRKPPEQLDVDRDGQISIQELFQATVEAVEARFAVDKRAPTEHAQLDDNGDGVSTELKPAEMPVNPDGALARKTIAMKVEPSTPQNSSSRSKNGANSILPPAR